MPHSLEIDKVLKLLAAAKADDDRAWLLMAVTFIHALRASEAVGLKPSNVIGTKLVVKRLKNSKPVEDELLEHKNPLLNEREPLLALCRKTKQNQRLFSITSRTFQRWVHRYGERAGLEPLYCHPHALKHSILQYLRETMDLDELQDRSGHKSLDSLRVYLCPKKDITDRMVRDAFAAVPTVAR